MSLCFELGCAGCEDCCPYDEDDGLCPDCHGDGTDKWNDHLLPCPTCSGRIADGVPTDTPIQRGRPYDGWIPSPDAKENSNV